MKANLSKFCVGLGFIAALAACNKSSNTTTAATPPGPGANLSCTSSGKNAFSTFGAAAFVAVNEQIFTNVNSEISANGTTNLGTSFTLIGSGHPASTADNLATFKGNLAAFLVYVYGGPTAITYTDGVSYVGPQDMTESHAGLNITSAQYTYFLNNIVVPALTAKGVSSADVSSCFAPPLLNSTFMASIVGH